MFRSRNKQTIFCNFAIFGTIFIKFSPNCTELGMLLFTILGSFCSFLDWEGTDIRPKNRHRKFPEPDINSIANSVDPDQLTSEETS